MEKKEKLEFLRKLKEKQLTEKVIMPLLEQMGFKNITSTHGVNEKGLDLIFYKENEFCEREYTGVQVKAVNIHGIAGKKGNATEILTQAQQAFAHSFHCIYDNKVKYIERYIVITSGKINRIARESVKEQLIEMGKYKTIQFFDGNKLVDLIDENMRSFFWKEYDFFNKYFNAMREDFETIRDISAIGQKEAIGLEDIYVSLKLSEKSRERPLTINMVEMGEKIFNVKSMEKRSERQIKGMRMIDPDTAVRKFHRLLILGEPGAGKTTLLKHLALKFCKENIKKQDRIIVPIPITLREFSESGKGLSDYINMVFEKYGFYESKEFVIKDLEAGRCMLLMDGFDELAARENQEQVAKQIHSFVNQHPECRIVVTSRTVGYHEELIGFSQVEVMEFDRSQIRTFIDKWFGASHKKKAASMLKAMMENENIEILAKNPLMVTIIAIIYEEDRELPQRRCDLYKRAIEVLLRRWDLRRKIKNRFSPDKKEFILKKLAFRCHCQNRRIITERDVLEEIETYSDRIGLGKDEVKSFLEEICLRSCILRQVSINMYEFLHLSFQEYFTALELKELDNGIATIISHISEPWWEEPILLYAGISKDAGVLIRRIQDEVPEDIFYSNLVLSGRCIADADFTEPRLKEETTQKLWFLYKGGEFPLLKVRAMYVLRCMRPRTIIDALIEQLTDKTTQVRESAAETLGAIGSADTVPHLVETMSRDNDSSVRRRAAAALGAIGSADAVAQLVKTMTADNDNSVRECAIAALGVIGSANAINHLVETMINDKNNSIRERAAEALGAIGGADAISYLIEVMNDDKDSSVRAHAAEALGAIGSDDVIPQLIEIMTNDRNSSVRAHAAEALGAIGSIDCIPQLLEIMTNDKNSTVRAYSVKSLGAIGSDGSIPQLLETLKKDKDSSVRGHAAKALGAIGSDDVISQLLETMNIDKDGDVRWCATEALGIIGSEEPIPHLIEIMATNKDNEDRKRAVDLLGNIGNEVAIQPLKQVLDQALIGESDYLEDKLKDKALKDKVFEALYKISMRLGMRINMKKNEDLDYKIDAVKKAKSPLKDFRNLIEQVTAPVKSIVGYAEDILKGKVPKEKIREKLSYINKLSKVSLKYASNFEKLLELDSLQFNLNKEKLYDLRDYLIGISIEYQPLIKTKCIFIRVTNQTVSNITLYVDKELFYRAVSNIVDNTIKYSFFPEERLKLGFQAKSDYYEDNENVLITATEGNDSVIITISSYGLEILEEERDKIFDRGYRGLKAKERYPVGAGIGLYIAKKIIELHNGKIELVTHTPKYNTIFKIILPKEEVAR